MPLFVTQKAKNFWFGHIISLEKKETKRQRDKVAQRQRDKETQETKIKGENETKRMFCDGGKTVKW